MKEDNAPITSQSKAVKRVAFRGHSHGSQVECPLRCPWILGQIQQVRENIDEFSGEGFVTETMKGFAKVALFDLENRIKDETRSTAESTPPQDETGATSS